jgi:hypothetical protein
MLLQKNPPTTPTHALYPHPLAATPNPNSLPRRPSPPPLLLPSVPVGPPPPSPHLLSSSAAAAPAAHHARCGSGRGGSGAASRGGAARRGRALPAGQRPAEGGRTGTARAKALPASPPPRRPRRARPPPRASGCRSDEDGSNSELVPRRGRGPGETRRIGARPRRRPQAPSCSASLPYFPLLLLPNLFVSPLPAQI